MPSAVASAMPGEDEPAEYGECHENAKLDGAGLHYVCHMWYSSSVLSVSGCIENNSEVHLLLLLQPSNNAHNASPPRSARLKRRHLLEVTAALCTASARPRVQPALAYTARGSHHHRDIAYHLACYKHTRIPKTLDCCVRLHCQFLL